MKPQPSKASPAFRFVLLLGVVSLFGDLTYEGARSITGPFLALLGASGAAVGLVAGAGELVGYGIRLFSGTFADRTGRHWMITGVGYTVNLMAIPALALVGRWESAAGLMVAERFGKAIRTPARDAMLSHAASSVGRGWAFGVHEAMDQVGALAGPLLVAGILYFGGTYRGAFAVLLIPALAALAALGVARARYPVPRDLETESPAPLDSQDGLPRVFWIYLIFVSLSVAGFAHFQLIGFHMARTEMVGVAGIPLAFALAMGVDALAALGFGRLYDKVGLRLLAWVPVLTLPIAWLVFSSSFGLVLGGLVLWGVVLGIQETIMRASIGSFVAANKRATAYGIFNAAFGASWFLGSALMGVLYDVSISWLMAFSVTLQIAALIAFWPLARLNQGGR